MIQPVSGNALFDLPSGSAGVRSDEPHSRPAIDDARDSGRTTAAHDATPRAHRAAPLSQVAGAEKPTGDAPRGSVIDLRV